MIISVKKLNWFGLCLPRNAALMCILMLSLDMVLTMWFSLRATRYIFILINFLFHNYSKLTIRTSMSIFPIYILHKKNEVIDVLRHFINAIIAQSQLTEHNNTDV